MDQPDIEISDLRKSFGRNDVLRGVSLNIQKGESFALIGGSGVGKSVVLKCILGLIKPDAGQVLVRGSNPVGRRTRGEAKIGMLFQGGALFDLMPVWQNVSFRQLRGSNLLQKSQARAVALNLLGRGGRHGQVSVRAFGRHAEASKSGEGNCGGSRHNSIRRANDRLGFNQSEHDRRTHSKRVHPNFFGYAAAARQALHSRKSGHRMFSRQHLTVSRALVPAIRESSEADPGSTHAEPTRSRLQPSETELRRNTKTQKRLKPKKLGCTHSKHCQGIRSDGSYHYARHGLRSQNFRQNRDAS